ncbi:MAG: translation initiation factor IF-2 [Deltaproteobacteria bacterium]|nr:translation initiation factor IF-2 [Deltaproteobacteria bacterium]
MAKKRVHELAKELGLDNKEVLERLQAAGIDVKSHSSSVHEDEAKAVLVKGKAPPPAPKKAAAGMTIVRKRQKEEPAAAPVVEPPVDEMPEAPAEEAIAAQPSEVSPVEEAPGQAEAPPPPAPAARRPGERPRAAATVVRMIDRDKLMERVPQRRQRSFEGPVGPKFGEVTELRVVTDPFGRGREMVDVESERHGRAKTGGGVAAARGKRAPSKREMMEMRERAMHPSRLKKKKTVKRAPKKPEVTQPRASKRVIKMKGETIVLSDLAHQIGVKATELVQKLMEMGQMVAQNAAIDLEIAQVIANAYDYTVESLVFAEGDVLEASPEEDRAEDLASRPPVVTVMGHVDHGKTSLLDAIRRSKVAEGEHGGITQHIGAYQVMVPGRGKITFLDTPGHAAFTSMRARGAQVTDLVVLVVAADAGVMPKTEEALKHAQAAEVPIIVAVNKIDKPDAQPDRVMQQLAKYGLQSEQWGGDTLFVKTSATKGTGIQELLDAILLQAEMQEIKANPKRPAMAVVIEAKLDRGRGPVASVLVQQGTLRRGDPVVVGEAHGKIRAMLDEQGRDVREAPPATPVELTGLDEVPNAGDQLHVVASADAAGAVAEHRRAQRRAQEVTSGPKMSLEDLLQRMQDSKTLDLRIVLKADVQGSVEAVRDTLQKLSTDEISVNILYAGVGGINESDVMLASASDGIVLGFNVRPDTNARSVAEREGVEIRVFQIIYEMVDDVRKAMEGKLKPEAREKIVGHAEVRELFKISKVGTIAGSRVTDGKALRSARIRVLRDGVQVYESKLSSLKRFKDDAREVESGQECGVGIEGFNDIKVGDVLEFFQVEEVARRLQPGTPGKRSNVEAHP